MKKRLSWDEYFITQAKTLALRSTCERLSVGCVLVKDNRTIAGGYNGSISGDEHCIDVGCKVIDHHCVRTIHAEINALLQCAKFGVSTEGAVAYVTHFPCLNCAKSLIQAGVSAVYWEEDYRNNEYAQELFDRLGVKTGKVSSPYSHITEKDITS